MALQDLLKVIGQLKGSLGDLYKDVDERDSREETGYDFDQVVTNFEEIKRIFQNLEREDMMALQREITELVQGEETFQEYVRDVNSIVKGINKKNKSGPAKKKLEQNLPIKAKGAGVQGTFGDIEGLFSQLSGWIETLQTAKR